MIVAILVLLVSLLTAGYPEPEPVVTSVQSATVARADGVSVPAYPPTATREQGNRPQQPDLIAVGGKSSGRIGTALIGGNISQAAPSFGPRYLAVRAPRGTLVRICAETCVVMRSTDYGPSSKIRPPRIADVALVVWRRVCGKPASAGLCKGSVEFLGVVRVPSPPATDTE